MVRRRRAQAAELRQKLLDLRSWGATTIQAAARGMRGRADARRVAVEHCTRWKEMYDSDRQRNFYYNCVTGEMRWRRPQDILSLMRRPACTNCAAFEAAVECADCKEFSCSVCWAQVHGGGKRAQHSFRSLYDYYGKRVDYLATEFPSRWPTELEQDDTQGWLLRVDSEQRAPTREAAGWQEFAEAGRAFYYRPITKEGTYICPPAFAAAAAAARSGEAEPQLAIADDSQWETHYDEGSGLPFFYSLATGESTWSPPPPR